MMRRRPRRAYPEHHVDDSVYWSRVAVRHARAAVRHAERAERYADRACWQAGIAAGVLAAGLVVFVIVQVLG